MSIYDTIADRLNSPNVPMLDDLWQRTQEGTAAQQQRYANQQKQIDQQTAATRNLVAQGPRPAQGIINRAQGQVQTMTPDQVNTILPDHAWSSTLGDYNPQTTNPDGSPRTTPYAPYTPPHTPQVQAVRAPAAATAPATATAAPAAPVQRGAWPTMPRPLGMTEEEYQKARVGIGPPEWVQAAMEDA